MLIRDAIANARISIPSIWIWIRLEANSDFKSGTIKF
jgi:hypothetical protein